MSTPLSQADAEKIAEELGNKLGFLLSVAPWPDDVKAAWADLLEYMSTEEITEFSDTLELLYADAMTADIDKAFEAQVAELRGAQGTAHIEQMKQLETLFSKVKQRIEA